MSYDRFNLADNPSDVGQGILIKVRNHCKLSSDSAIAPPQIPDSSQCADSDGGLNYYVRGTFSGLWNGEQITNTDSCVDALDDTGDDVPSSNYLGEGYCENNQLKVERITCPNGCNNGACI